MKNMFKALILGLVITMSTTSNAAYGVDRVKIAAALGLTSFMLINMICSEIEPGVLPTTGQTLTVGGAWATLGGSLLYLVAKAGKPVVTTIIKYVQPAPSGALQITDGKQNKSKKN